MALNNYKRLQKTRFNLLSFKADFDRKHAVSVDYLIDFKYLSKYLIWICKVKLEYKCICVNNTDEIFFVA